MSISSVEAEQLLTHFGATPIDQMAWRVIRPGEKYVPDKKITQLVFDSQPPLRDTRRARHEQRPENMRGRSHGLLTVIGYWGPKKDGLGRCRGGSANQLWVCRCACGIFVTRTAKTIKRAHPSDRCEFCRHLAYLKRNEEWRRTGRNADETNEHSRSKS